MERDEPPTDVGFRGMVLAAGEGTRLRPLTLECPKPMLPVGGRPVLEHTISWLREQGVQRIAVNLNHYPEVVTAHFADGSAFGVSLQYSLEEELLGTAGGARRMAGIVPGPYVIVYGDVLTDAPLRELLALHAAHADRDHLTIALFQAPDPTAVGVVELAPDDRVKRFVEKPPAGTISGDLASAGIFVADAGILERIPPDSFCDFGHDLIPSLIEEGVPVYGWRIPPGYVLVDMGTSEGYEQAQEDARLLGRMAAGTAKS